MSMTRVFLGLAALPLLAGVALAAPTQLTDRQMDKIAAGADFYENTTSNGAVVVVSVHERAPNQFDSTVSSSAHPLYMTTCVNEGAACGATNQGDNFIGGAVGTSSVKNTAAGTQPYYLLINNYALSVGAAFR